MEAFLIGIMWGISLIIVWVVSYRQGYSIGFHNGVDALADRMEEDLDSW